MREDMPSLQSEDRQTTSRETEICEAAFDVFARYGVRKTSMQDIARAAGMSRPALYQYFPGKEAIARHLVGLFFEAAEAAVREALCQPGTPSEILARAFRAKAGARFEAILDSPHGQELIEVGNATSADIVADGEARLAALFADWLSREAMAGRIILIEPPEAMARTILAALDGVKAPPFAAFEAHMSRLARLFGRGLSAKVETRSGNSSIA